MTAEFVSTASRPPGEPRLRSHGPPVWLLALLGTALTATFFYSGYLNGDANWQYRPGTG